MTTQIKLVTKNFTTPSSINLVKEAIAELVEKHPTLAQGAKEEQFLLIASFKPASKLCQNGIAVKEVIGNYYLYVFFSDHVKATTESDQLADAMPSVLGHDEGKGAHLFFYLIL